MNDLLLQASKRSKAERIAVWTRTKDVAVNLGIGKRIIEALNLRVEKIAFDVCAI